MSSSADPGPALSWADFNPRSVSGGGGDFISPESELRGLAQRYEDELRKQRDRADDAAAAEREVVYDLAADIGRLGQLVAGDWQSLDKEQWGLLRQQLSVLRNQMLDRLARAGIELDDPVGRPYEEVEDWTEVAAWIPQAGFDRKAVARTEKVAVLRGGAVVRLARVVMGEPLETQDNPESGEGA